MNQSMALDAKKQQHSETPLLSGLLPHAAIRPAFDEVHTPPGLSSLEPPTFGHDFSQVPAKSPAASVQAASCPMFPRRCPFGGACHTCPARVQAKLTIGQPDDEYEREADRVADQVMRMPEPAANRPASDTHLQRACPQCDDELRRQPADDEKKKEDEDELRRQPADEDEKKREDEDEQLQAKPAGGMPLQDQASGASIAPPLVHEVLSSPGQPLDLATRAFMEPRFGRDFGQVRVHTDARAAESARAVNALAYTVGRDVVFEAGQYAPETSKGQRLMAHELTHTIQQRMSGVSNPTITTKELRISAPDDRSEIEADAIADHVEISPLVPGALESRLPAVSSTAVTLARYNCSQLDYNACRTGVYKCGYGGSGTCGWVGLSRGGCICVGAMRPPIRRVLEVLAIIGLSVALLATIIAALLDPEPVTKLALAGLSAAQIGLLLVMLGYEERGESSQMAATATGTRETRVA